MRFFLPPTPSVRRSYLANQDSRRVLQICFPRARFGQASRRTASGHCRRNKRGEELSLLLPRKASLIKLETFALGEREKENILHPSPFCPKEAEGEGFLTKWREKVREEGNRCCCKMQFLRHFLRHFGCYLFSQTI